MASVHDLRLEPEKVDPFFRWFAHRRWHPAWLLLLFPAMFAVLALVTAPRGQFVHAHPLQTYSRDLLHVLRVQDGSTDTDFPLLRDYPSLTCTAVAAATLLLAFLNCRLMATFAQELHEGGLLLLPEQGQARDEVLRAVRRTNLRFARCGQFSWMVALGSLATAALLMAAYRAGGAFFALAPSGAEAERRAWSKAAYTSWWASLAPGHWAGVVVYWLFAALISYIMIKHNLMGICFILFFVAIRNRVTYGVDQGNTDGFHGWSPMRRLLGYVIFSLLLSVVAFSSLFIGMSAGEIPWTAPFLILYLIALPAYILVPNRLLKSAMRDFRTRETAGTREEFAQARDNCPPLSVDRFQLRELERAELNHLRTLDIRLFKIKELVATASVYLASLVATLARTFMH